MACDRVLTGLAGTRWAARQAAAASQPHSAPRRRRRRSCLAALQSLHGTVLPGKLVLQVDEVVNIGAAIRERYSGNDGISRCLMLLLSDGGCCAVWVQPQAVVGATEGCSGR